MVAGGIQPNWRHIFLALVMIALIYYMIYGNRVEEAPVSIKEEIEKVNMELYFLKKAHKFTVLIYYLPKLTDLLMHVKFYI